jgi:hypothetical protein
MTKFINPSNLPQPYVNAVMNDEYDAGECDYTPSSLMKPPYMAALTRDHEDEIEIDVADRFFALQGKMAHKLLEQSEKKGSNAIVELRVYAEVSKWVVGMQFDRLHMDKDSMSLQDWKMTTVYKFKKDYRGNYPEVDDWEVQLNIGAFILRQGGWFKDASGEKKSFKAVKIDKLEIIGLLRDFRKADARRDKLYPQSPVVVRQIKMWSDDEVVAYIHKRATAHDIAKNQKLSLVEPCTMEEMWAKETTFAIMKIGNKRARKAGFETFEKASAHIEENEWGFDKHTVEKRAGARNRCEGYCDVSKFCPAYKKWAKENSKEAIQEKRNNIKKYLGDK